MNIVARMKIIILFIIIQLFIFTYGIKWSCYIWSCCKINTNLKNFENNIKTKFYGQPLASQIVYNSIKNHVNNPNPKKALVLSFHGWTGTGKNLLSKLIAEELYPNDKHKIYSHLYIGTREFKHESEVEKYKDFLQKDIEKKVKDCERSIFIIDEVHTIPVGVLNALQPYVDFHEHINGVDYRKSIFILLSNTGGSEILRLTYKFWENGLNREDMVLKDIEPLIKKGSYIADSGLGNSTLINSYLINAFVPFLPLERKHVRMCIKQEFEELKQPYTDSVIDNIADELDYGPTGMYIYSKSGCKKIFDKVNQYLD